MNVKVEGRLNELLRALNFEKNHEIQEHLKAIKNNSIQERVESGNTLYPLHYLGVGYSKFGDVILQFEIHKKQSATKFSTGKIVELFNVDNESAKGIVEYVSFEKLSLKINLIDIEDWVKKGNIGLNLLPDSKTYDLYIDNLTSIKDTVIPNQVNYIYDTDRLYLDAVKSNGLSLLNASQNKAINNIVESESPVIIIHGPPGTGKTTTIVSAIKHLVSEGKKILVCAPTNAAVDNVCHKLMEEKLTVCRIGNPVKVDSTLHKITLDGLAISDRSFKIVEQLKKQSVAISKKAFKFKRNFDKSAFQERKALKQELKLIRKDIKVIQKDIYKHVLETSNVICGTFIGVLSEKLNKLDFDYVFVDEAGQALEPAIWSTCKMANKLVLAGDDFQLPPFVQSVRSTELGLNRSILEMAKEHMFPTQFLNIQYRMNSKIMSYSNSYFYNSNLIASKNVDNWRLDSDDFEPIEFIDTAGCGFEETKDDNSNGLFNRDEIDLIEKRCENLDLEKNTYGLISPYRLQVKMLQEKLNDRVACINTIDSFQGQERDIIIISLVRSNIQSEIGFLKDYRRMNVAMTRARKKLIIIGDSATLGMDDFYSRLISFIEINGSYRTAWEYFES
jgi:ATP-dependent RNA/DNA helicase IGHMBP2